MLTDQVPSCTVASENCDPSSSVTVTAFADDLPDAGTVPVSVAGLIAPCAVVIPGVGGRTSSSQSVYAVATVALVPSLETIGKNPATSSERQLDPLAVDHEVIPTALVPTIPDPPLSPGSAQICATIELTWRPGMGSPFSSTKSSAL